MLPTSAGVEPAASWSPVGRHIQLSHRGRLVYTVHHLQILVQLISVHSSLPTDSSVVDSADCLPLTNSSATD